MSTFDKDMRHAVEFIPVGVTFISRLAKHYIFFITVTHQIGPTLLRRTEQSSAIQCRKQTLLQH